MTRWWKEQKRLTALVLLVIYYASSVFQSYGFSEGTTAELATGVTGSVFMASTIPAMVCPNTQRQKRSLITASIDVHLT